MPRRSYEAYRASKLSSGARRPSVIESETDADSLASFSTLNSSTSYLTSPVYSYSPHRPSPPTQSGSSSRITPSPRQAPPSLTPQSYSTSTSASSPAPISANSASTLGALGALGLSHLDAAAPAPRLRQRTFSSSSSIASASHSPSLAPLLEQPSPHADTRAEPVLPRSASQSRHGSSLLPPAFGSRGRSPTSLEEREKRRRKREERIQRSTLRGETFDSPLRRVIRNLSIQGKSQWGLVLGLAAVGLLRALVVLLALGGGEGHVGSGQSHAMIASVRKLPGLRLLPNAFSSYNMSTRAASGWQLLFEGAIWWTALVAWITTEAKRGGRSWRTQLTGIMTVLLCPAFLVLSSASPRSLPTLGTALWSLVFFAREKDLVGCLVLALSILLETKMAWYLPAVGAYLAGKALYTGGKQAAIHAMSSAAALAPALGMLLWSSASSLSPGSVTLPLDKRPAFGALHIPWVSPEGESRLCTIASVVAAIPTVLIVLYTSLSFRSSQNAKTATLPTIRLLVPALFTSSLPCLLFSRGPGFERYLPLMPLGMMMALRGGKESGKSENDTWELGVVLYNTVVLSSMSDLKPVAQLATAASVLLWNWTIGYAPGRVQSSWIRSTGLAIYPVLGATVVIRLVASGVQGIAILDRIAAAVGGATCFGVFFTAYLWSHKKLIENAWALSGLGLGEGKKAL